MSTDLRSVYGPNLRAERARRGLHQSEVAEAAGMPRTTYADVEAERRRLHLGEAADLCAALGITLAALLAGDGEAAEARRCLGVHEGHEGP